MDWSTRSSLLYITTANTGADVAEKPHDALYYKSSYEKTAKSCPVVMLKMQT